MHQEYPIDKRRVEALKHAIVGRAFLRRFAARAVVHWLSHAHLALASTGGRRLAIWDLFAAGWSPAQQMVCSSDDLRRALQKDACRVDVLHTHGLWLMPNVYPAWAALRRRLHTALHPRVWLFDCRDFAMKDGGMMWGMGLGHLLVGLVLLLAIAALIKYLFFR
jgi:hypothetical protein